MKLSIILPTYNNEKTIEECLKSIFMQEFSKKDFEVLFIDGGSKDKTLEIARKYPVKIIKNPKRNEEAARIIGIKKAKGKIICFIDADNILVGKNWIKKCIKAFRDKEISFADTLYYSYRKGDKIGVKYQALIGGDDPIIMYLGAYSRWSYLKDDWTDFPHKDEDKGDYLKSRFLDKNKIPPMGSNGFLVRTSITREFIKDNFIHSDFIYDIVNKGHNCFAKIKIGLIHNQPKFFPNKVRRMQRRKEGIGINYNYGIKGRTILILGLSMALIFPILFDTLKGFFKKPDFAWFFHPIACLGELFIYSWYFFKHGLGDKFD